MISNFSYKYFLNQNIRESLTDFIFKKHILLCHNYLLQNKFDKFFIEKKSQKKDYPQLRNLFNFKTKNL